MILVEEREAKAARNRRIKRLWLLMVDRRQFLRTSVSAGAASSIAAWAANTPVKIAHRKGNMPKKPEASAYELASSIPGLSGLEIGGARQKANAGALTPAEDAECKDFVEAVDLISIMQAKARRFLAKRSA